MRLSYILVTRNRRQAALDILRSLSANTPLPAQEWEAFCIDNASTDDTAAAVRAELPNVRLFSNRLDKGPAAANQALAACRGRQVIKLREGAYPADGAAILSLLSHLDSDPAIGAVAGRMILPDGSALASPLPSLATPGASCFRKTVLDRIGGFSTLFGQAAEYDLGFRIFDAGFRIDKRDDIIFRSQGVAGGVAEGKDADRSELRARIRDHLIVASRRLPARLARIYWHDWWMREKALAAHAGHSRAAWAGYFSACLARLAQLYTAPQPISRQAIEDVFEYRRHAAMVGDWARRNSVWRVVLADFSENIWATYNACRSTGLQMRCIADSNPALAKLVYRGLPIVPANRAFEGGGIDGVIITHSDPAQIEANFKILRNHFHGPILRLTQTPRVATRVQATAA
ncbi:MAG: glycosyltransferase [Tepidisphaeraceae bacterium]